MPILRENNVPIERCILAELDTILKCINHARIDMDNIFYVKNDESCSIDHFLEAILYVLENIENRVSQIIKANKYENN